MAKQKYIAGLIPEPKTSTDFLIIGGVAAVGYFGIIKPILVKLGVMQSSDSKAVDNALNSNESPFSPNFYKKKTPSLILTIAVVDKHVQTIYNAFGLFNDDEEAVIGVFRGLRTQSQVSFLAERFGNKHGDLLTFLRGGPWPQDRLSDSDVASLINMVSQKPKYTV